MNERIKELAKQASDAVAGNAFSMARYNEKFAELIIEECNDVAYGLLEENTGAEVVMRIREHFGVER